MSDKCECKPNECRVDLHNSSNLYKGKTCWRDKKAPITKQVKCERLNLTLGV